MVFWLVHGVLLFWDNFSQHSIAKGQSIQRWWMYSLAAKQLGQREGVMIPHLCRFSTVRFFPLRRVHIKKIIFGRAPYFQTTLQWFQNGMGWLLLQRSWWAALMVYKDPEGSHLNPSKVFFLTGAILCKWDCRTNKLSLRSLGITGKDHRDHSRDEGSHCEIWSKWWIPAL